MSNPNERYGRDHPEFDPNWDVLRDENGDPVTLTAKQSQAVWRALSVVEQVRHHEGYESLWTNAGPNIAKSRLLGRMLLEGLPPTRTKPPIVVAGPYWAGLPGGDPFAPHSQEGDRG